MELRQLLKKCRKGDRLAQSYFFDTYQWGMYRYCRRLVNPDIFTEEVISNGFRKFFKSLDVFDYKSEEATLEYLKKIMKRECLIYLRNKTNFHLYVTEESGDAKEDVSSDEDLVSKLTEKELRDTIDKLPPNYRAVFGLAVFENMPHAEIAEELGINETTSRAQFKRARQLLQQMLIEQNKDYESRLIKRDKKKS